MTGTDPDAAVGFRPDQLDGFRIGVTSDRRSEDLIAAFERRGAAVTHAPTIRMRGVDTEGALEEETRAIVAARPDVLLATTSYGLRRWLEAADAAGIELADALSSARILVRGPKARGAIRAAGLDDHGMSERETTTSLVDLALREGVAGRTIAVQLHGFTDPAQLQRLRDAGARVLTAAPYRWSVHEDSARVLRLIDAVCGGGIDAVTFTSAPAVEALFTVAEAAGRLDDLQAAFRETVVAAAVGPVTAAPLVEAGILPVVPDRFRMGALIRLTCEHLEQASPRIETAFGTLELRGRHAVLAGTRVALTPVALALFRTLVAAEGATVARHVLAASAPEALDDHAVDVAISRLRQALPEPRLVATVIKRGYRLATPL
ncbi:MULTISPECIES: uroporphyrinogen-III synthase [unclassified Rathayibacter]|uniref:uroporphyrinogen-III synthase n=1 Tax=unclassified Rathayibacter TaxID=2609250 RepID=UPI000CE71E01|nr:MULTISPECIES: uroporphyrinogen-III synthase [unclassified Rathayibacter]PPF24537.1 uroporphyrinogen-III synthase [Rathayibacter sp. AY1F2]PPH45008.1 uroporphyrinogen-III synthase [Rathayibacter sp. AY1F7]PPI15578.1 uroporphyrinogen-III synthase [Rathayibacter sp. AY1D2]